MILQFVHIKCVTNDIAVCADHLLGAHQPLDPLDPLDLGRGTSLVMGLDGEMHQTYAEHETSTLQVSM